MNSVIIHFKGPSYEEIESRAKDIKIIDGSCSSEEGENFQFWRYEDYKTEYAPEEKSIVENSIGGKPTASFQLLCRTSCGRFALDKMIKLFSIVDGVMDDDNDGYWQLKQMKSAYLNSSASNIYNLNEHTR
jgi:hypothetical protein